MLVLSRKCGEAIVIGDNIVVSVLEVKGGRVKLGFTAPSDAPIHRGEVYKRIVRQPPFVEEFDVRESIATAFV